MPAEKTPLVGDGQHQSLWRVLWAVTPALLGTMIESYDYTVYTSLAPEITTNFFPGASAAAVWVPYALGQAMRPVGGVVMGYVGDAIGRKPAIILSTVAMASCSGLMGVLPSVTCCSEGWALTGEVLIYVLRTVQGLFQAGQVLAIFVYTVERVGPAKAGAAIGASFFFQNLGSVLAIAVASLLETSLTAAQQELWGWRVPFLLCLPLGGVLLFFQCTLEESSDFEAAVKAAEERRGAALASDKEGGAPAFLVRQRSFTFLGPLCQLVQEWGLHLLIAFLLSSGSCVMGYGTGTGFAKDFLDESLERPIIFAGNAALIIAFASLFGEALWSLISDTIGFVASSGLFVVLGLILIYPLWLMLAAPSALVAYAGAALVGLVQGGHNGLIGLPLGLFPVELRSSGYGLAYNLAMLVWAAPAPIIETATWDMMGGGNASTSSLAVDGGGPAIWNFLGIVASGAGLLVLRRAVRTGAVERVSYLRDEHF